MKTKNILSSIFLGLLSFGAVAENITLPTEATPVNTVTLSTENISTVSTTKTIETIIPEGGGDGYDDEFAFSRRIRRFHTHQNSGSQQRWGYYDPYYSSDVYYMVNTPAWNSYYYGGYYASPMTTVIVRPTFWGVLAAVLFAPTYYNYGYYNPSPVGWGYYGGQGYYNGWNQCYWGGGSYGYGYFGGYNSGFYNGYNQGYNNGYYNGYNNGYNQGYYDGFNNGYNNGGGYANGGNGDDWWYWKNHAPRPAMNTNTGKGGTGNAVVPTGGRNEVGMNQTSIVRPTKGEVGVQSGNLSDRPVTSHSHSDMNSKPTTEPVRNGSVKWDAQTGDEPVRSQTQPTRPTWSSEPSRPSTTSPRPQENMGSMPAQPARPQTQIHGNRPENEPSGFQNESRPNPNFENRPNKPNYDNQQSSPYNSGNHSNPTTQGRPNGERPDFNAPRTPQNGHNSGSNQNQPSMSRPQPQTAPANTPPASKSNDRSVKLPASGRKGGLSYNPAYSIVP